MNGSKQRILGGLAVAVASLGLAACGSSEETDPAASPPTTTAVTPTTAAADTSASELAATVDTGAQAAQDLVAQALATDALKAAVQTGDEEAIEAAVDAASRACPECPRPPHTHAIIAGGPGLVAVGAYDALDDRADIWTSSDGQTWSRVRGDLGPGVINDVITAGPWLVAVGDGNAKGSREAFWTSRDGLTWNRAPDDPVFNRTRMEAVTAGGPGLVAVGRHNRAWFSSDGLTWESASVPPVPPDVSAAGKGNRPAVFMTHVAEAGDRLVAVGWAMRNDDSRRGVVWTSADGMTWIDVTDDLGFPSGGPTWSVRGGSDGFTINGVWTSADGLQWRRVSG